MQICPIHVRWTPGGSGLNITDYYKAAEKQHHARVEACRATREKNEAKINEIAAGIGAFVQERSKKAELMAQAKAEGMDTAKLALRIEELDAKIKSENERLTHEKVKAEELKDVAPRAFYSEQRGARFLAEEVGCVDAVEVDGLHALYEALQFRITKWDAGGHPLQLELDLGHGITKEVAIRNAGSRFRHGFLPESLSWLHGAARKEKSAVDSRQLLAFLETKSERLLISRTEFHVRREHKVAHYGTSQYVTETVNLDNIAESLDIHIGAMLDNAGGKVDLNVEYSSNALLQSLKARIVTMTDAEPRFKPRTRYLTNTEVYATLHFYWKAFVACPWAANVDGEMALLKYLVEGGEKPRVWSGEYEGQFGFRIRTRDHSWINGQIFVEENGEEPSPDARMVITYHRYMVSYQERVATVGSNGRFKICVGFPCNTE